MSKLNLLLVQPDTFWERPDNNFKRIESLVEGKTDGVHLVILPEMFATGFSMNSHKIGAFAADIQRWMELKANEWQCCLMGSAACEQGGVVYNRLFFASTDGMEGWYDKRHLFRMGQEHEAYNPGTQRKLFNLNGWRILPQVCYDLRFPVWMRNSEGYDLAVVVANWPEARHDTWLTLLKARAIENLAYVVGVNRTGTDGNGIVYGGGSVAIDFKGQVMVEAGMEEQVIAASLEKSSIEAFRKKFPAHLDADKFCLEL